LLPPFCATFVVFFFTGSAAVFALPADVVRDLLLLGCYTQAHAWCGGGVCQGFYNFTVLRKVLADTGSLAERTEAVAKLLKGVKATPEAYVNLTQLWGVGRGKADAGR
jgi:hypothetical protein